MISARFRIWRIHLAIVLCTVGGTIALTRTSTSLGAGEEKPRAALVGHIHALRVERREVLRKLADADQLRFKKGVGSAAEVSESMAAFLASELELCATPEDRVKVHDQIVDAMRKAEETAESMYESGRSTQAEVYKVKAHRLKAEINLAEANLAVASPHTSKPIE